ncbi:hypothetical protein PI124_g11027 [Phytophthora idaei]|nr:hypothetical protein PI125_g20457 [Phytophthora idaei]KAG3244194.1 hypothetical protein PI124_g11027 [Phytophthora idaei]
MDLEICYEDTAPHQLSEVWLSCQGRQAGSGFLQRRGRASSTHTRFHSVRSNLVVTLQQQQTSAAPTVENSVLHKSAKPLQRLSRNQPPRQRTKKQLAADANKRRRELAAFGEVWGHQNGSEADGTMVEPPATSSPDQVLYEDIEKLECCQTDISYADKKCFIDAANADRVAGVVANADMDGWATEADADISANGDEAGFTAEANAGMAQQGTEPIADTAAGFSC